MNKFKPDFIGIGTERAATTWISACLREHPEVNFAKTKEIYFFNEYDPHFLKVKNLKYKRGLAWYKTRFDLKKIGIVGEFSPTYLFCKKAAVRIKKLSPEIKLIVSLRDPVERAFSQYLHDKRLGLIKNISFEEALKKSDSYLVKSTYFEPLSFYYSLFPKKNILVVIYDDIKETPEKVIARIYNFLGLKRYDFKPSSLYEKFLPTVNAAFPFLNQLMIHTEYFLKKREMESLVKILEISGIRKLAFNLAHYVNKKPYKSYPKIRRKTVENLRQFFKNDISNLEKLIEKDLSSWK